MMDERPPLSGLPLLLVTIFVSLGAFMQVLDATIANVSVPTIAGDLGVSPSQGTWVITSFGVANAIALPLTGWLARRFGEVRMFVLSTLGFVLTSWLCGFAHSLEFLVMARVLQGACAGPMFPLAQSLLMSCYPPQKRGLAMAISMMVIAVAPIVGPLLGGWITEQLSWSWIFYINLPVGLICVGVCWPLLRHRESQTTRMPIDGVGLGLLILGVGSLQILLDKGHELDWFASNLIVTLAVVAAIALCALIVWELTDRHPVVDLSLLGERNYLVAAVVISLGYMTFLGGVVVLPLWLQTNMGYTSTWAGIATAPIGILPVLLTPLLGKYLDRLNLRLIVTLGFLIFTMTFWWQSHYADNVDLLSISLPRLVQGFGMVGFFTPMMVILVSRTNPNHMPNAMGLVNFMRVLAGSFGTSLAVTLWDDRTSFHHQRLAEAVHQANPAVAQGLDAMGSLGLSVQQGMIQVERLLSREAMTMAVNDTFWIAGWIFFGLILLVWQARPPFGHPGSPPPVVE
ncbi:MFS transporter [Denitratisoma sp. DHT3]|uniref:DHA2 family efflux MFS transporter permease subunit n=1 Tax=Denitratisoma sp. DHT3 TaxID=1981880 RepID=UPI0011989DA9|nr:DHA2 family efflux MFS transporter permease subunit [Denitratisoma sp. DHT3]QDX80376.1 MFS transporter [Denitratisoma sp. DHT3]